jgi:dihydroneopterin aldolase
MTTRSYTIKLDGIRFRARHGVSRAERDLPQDFVVDLAVELPVDRLPKTDSRTRVFDYDVLSSLVVEVGTGASFKLLETLAQRVVEAILSRTPAVKARVSVKKFGPPTVASVDAASVEVVGDRDD